jgi:hypothetical protein
VVVGNRPDAIKMIKSIQRLTIATLFILGAELVCPTSVKLWRRGYFVNLVHAQSGPKTVSINRLRPVDPLDVSEVLEDGRPVGRTLLSQDDLKWIDKGLPVALPVLIQRYEARPSRWAYKFRAGDDWLKDLSLVVRNRTSKNIVYVDVVVGFPETKANGPAIFDDIEFGRIPANAAFTGSGQRLRQGSNKPIFLAPSQTMAFSLAAHDGELRRSVEFYRPFSTASLCIIEFQVYFGDGMKWFAGLYSMPDPTHPGRFAPMGFRYFPGQTHGRAAE